MTYAFFLNHNNTTTFNHSIYIINLNPTQCTDISSKSGPTHFMLISFHEHTSQSCVLTLCITPCSIHNQLFSKTAQSTGSKTNLHWSTSIIAALANLSHEQLHRMLFTALSKCIYQISAGMMFLCFQSWPVTSDTETRQNLSLFPLFSVLSDASPRNLRSWDVSDDTKC